MAEYGATSLKRLEQLHPNLLVIMYDLIELMDVTILETHRGKDRQDSLFEKGLTQVHYPHSKHNSLPSKAVDVAPYPIDWNDRERFHYMAGLIRGIAHARDLPIRWGGDWDSDGEVLDNEFDDLPHFELQSR